MIDIIIYILDFSVFNVTECFNFGREKLDSGSRAQTNTNKMVLIKLYNLIHFLNVTEATTA